MAGSVWPVLRFMMAGSAALTIVVMLAHPRTPVAQQEIAAMPFHDRWAEVMTAMTVVRLTPATVPVLLPPPSVVPPVPTRRDEVPPPKGPVKTAKPVKASSGDICRGRGKTYTRGGRSWRCRR